MKNKNKKIGLIIFLFSGFLLWQSPVFSFEEKLEISEVAHESGSNYWIKVFNPTSGDIIIPGEKFGLIDEAEREINKAGDKYLNCHGVRDKSKSIIFAKDDYVIIASDPTKFLAKYPSNIYPIISVPINNSKSKESDIKISADNCAVEKPKVEPKEYPDGLRLNEILPNPEGKNEEFIELFNDAEEDVDLEGWILRDGSKTGKYVFLKDSIVKAKEFLVVYKKDFKFALNDSGAETVRLFDPNEKEISVVNYSGAKDGLSFGLDGSKWRWSKTLTPGAENVFGDAPNFKVIKDSAVYKNFPANFDVDIKKYKKSKYKITWNFGDGHKSYKKTTTHKYDKKGKYKASVKIFNGSEEVIKEFKIEVKSFPKYDVEIIEVNPNPDGKDSDFETITVKNNSKKKINLQNWSIATGDKKLTNHPIASKITLKPKETLQITRALSKFTLNNKKANVELRYPTGKVASKMAYDKKTATIVEGEILEKTKLGWAWKNTALVANVPQAPSVPQETSLLAAAPETEQNLETPIVLGVATDFAGGYSERTPQKDFRILLAGLAYAPSFAQTEENNQSRIKPNFDFMSLFF